MFSLKHNHLAIINLKGEKTMKNLKKSMILLRQTVKAIILIVSISLFTVKVIGQTYVPGGPVTGTWTKDNEPYIITGHIDVVDSLIIKPGVRVQFNGYWRIDVGIGAKFIARGTENDSIIFEADPDTVQAPSSWGTILLTASGDDDVFEYCIIRHGHNPIYVKDSKPMINECRI